MSRPICVIAFLAVLVSAACSAPTAPASAGPPAASAIDVFFSPKAGATEDIVQELGRAKKEVLVQAYFFSYSVSLVTQGQHKFYTLTMPSDVLAKTCRE